MSCEHNDERLRGLAVDLLVSAANAWASNAPEIAERLCGATWALIGDDEFVDHDERAQP